MPCPPPHFQLPKRKKNRWRQGDVILQSNAYSQSKDRRGRGEGGRGRQKKKHLDVRNGRMDDSN